jgi:universal stress protein E
MMDSLVCVLPALLESTGTVTDKIAHLVKNAGGKCEVIVHAHTPALRRFFFFKTDDLNTRQLYEQALEEWLVKLKQDLKSRRVTYDINIVRDSHCAESVVTAIEGKQGPWLAMFHSGAPVSDDYMDVAHAVHCNMLLLDNRPWKQPPSIYAAIDPFHHDDEPAEIDLKIITQARHFCRLTDSKLHLLHCQFIPPFLLKHQTSIKAYINDSLREFVKRNHLKDVPMSVLSGNPVSTLTHYVKQKEADILVLGYVARGMIERSVVGSTAEALLKGLPCELMLVTAKVK